MVLAAGYGTRLWPLTRYQAKPAVPFLGRPLVSHTVDYLIKHGVTDIIVNTHYSPMSIERALEGMSVGLSHGGEILGTGGALALGTRLCAIACACVSGPLTSRPRTRIHRIDPYPS